MIWWGKILGGAFGFLFLGPVGALLGIALGHSLDVGLTKEANARQREFNSNDENIRANFNMHEKIQISFFSTTFAIMGYLAKADGNITKSEIAMASNLMAKMELNESLRKAAINLFNSGKNKDFDFKGTLAEFRKECKFRRDLLQMFVEIQFQAAYSDGKLTNIEKQILLSICYNLGFTDTDYVRFDAMHRSGSHWSDYSFNQQSKKNYSSTSLSIFDAYEILGVRENSPQGEVKKSYRKLMSQHHPDKLVSKGLPDEMMKMATEKAQEIKAAYELICKTKGW